MGEIFGGLLGFDSNEKLENFVDNADKTMAIKVVDLALSHCQQNGLFTMEESFVLYVMLKKLKENDA